MAFCPSSVFFPWHFVRGNFVLVKGATTVLKLGGPSAEGAEGDGAWGGGVPLPTGGGICVVRCAPSPDIFFDFLPENGEFWCILGGTSAL